MENELKKTCLNAEHRKLGATMAPFAGFDMPIEYSGLDSEHLAVRTKAGVFDVSHMGQVLVTGPDATAYVDHIFTNNVADMVDGQILYGMMTYENGGTVDDLLVYRISADKLFLVINASNIAKDLDWMRANASGYNVTITDYSDECGQIALQGPDSERLLADVLGYDAKGMTFYTFAVYDDGKTIISRTGYTGEDGFEVYASNERIVAMWKALMDAGVTPCGLGCRDTLRFEAGLPLYGLELGADISPIEAGLGIFVKTDKPGGFIGSEALAAQKAEGVARKIVGLEIDAAATARHGFEVLDTEGNTIGEITTGYNSLSVGKNIAMAIVDAAFAKLGTPVQVKIRRKTAPATVIKKRFYTPQYKK